MKQTQSKHDNTFRFIHNLRLRILRLRLSRTLAFDDLACMRVQLYAEKKRREPNIVSYKGHNTIDFAIAVYGKMPLQKRL